MGYRDPRTGLEEHRRALAAEKAQLDQQLSSYEAMNERRRAVERELVELEHVLSTRRLPIVQSVEIASPCNARWEKMAGDERRRFCGDCSKYVYDFSAMTMHEAEALILETEGRICARIYRRSDGSILTSDCPSGVRKKRRRRLAGTVAIAAAAAVATTTAGALALSSGDEMNKAGVRPSVKVPTRKYTMGVVSIDPERSGRFGF